MRVLGVIDPELLSEKFNPAVSDVSAGQRRLLLIELRPASENQIRAEIECDRSLGYRFRRIRWFTQGKLASETIADEYRDVDGIPYPFSYATRIFDPNGEIRVHTQYSMRNVELNMAVEKNDFKIMVPDGTRVTDTIIGMRQYKLDIGGYIGLDDALSIQADRIATDALVSSLPGSHELAVVAPVDTRPEKQLKQAIFVPRSAVAEDSNKPYILDLATRITLGNPSKAALDSKALYDKLSEQRKGDIAWNGLLVILRDAKAYSLRQSQRLLLKRKGTAWARFYELPKERKLPYQIIVTNAQGMSYMISILKVQADGIYVSCRELCSQETSTYRGQLDEGEAK